MQHDVIRYAGRYRYADRETLEHALASARSELADEGLDKAGAWLRFFVCCGTSLTVNASVPATAQRRFAAANVFLILAHGSIEGSVKAQRGDRAVDLLASCAND
jgi:hypothetical protein